MTGVIVESYYGFLPPALLGWTGNQNELFTAALLVAH